MLRDWSAIALGIYALASLAAAGWVWWDVGRQGLFRRWQRALLVLSTAVLAPLVWPVYVLEWRRPDRWWGIWGPAEMVGIQVLFGWAWPFALYVLLYRLGIWSSSDPWVFNAWKAAHLATLIWVCLHLARRRYGLPIFNLGLTVGRRWLSLTGLGLLACVANEGLYHVMRRAAMFLTTMLEGPAATSARLAAERDAVLDGSLWNHQGWAEVGWVLLVVGVLVPIAEEIFHRGVVYGGLRERWGVGWAVVVSSAVFAAVHFRVIEFAPLFAFGVLTALLYQRTGSLLPSIVVHAVNNSTVVLVLAR